MVEGEPSFNPDADKESKETREIDAEYLEVGMLFSFSDVALETDSEGKVVKINRQEDSSTKDEGGDVLETTASGSLEDLDESDLTEIKELSQVIGMSEGDVFYEDDPGTVKVEVPVGKLNQALADGKVKIAPDPEEKGTFAISFPENKE